MRTLKVHFYSELEMYINKFGFVLFKKVISNICLISISKQIVKKIVQGSLKYKPRKKGRRDW